MRKVHTNYVQAGIAKLSDHFDAVCVWPYFFRISLFVYIKMYLIRYALPMVPMILVFLEAAVVTSTFISANHCNSHAVCPFKTIRNVFLADEIQKKKKLREGKEALIKAGIFLYALTNFAEPMLSDHIGCHFDSI